MRNSPFIFCALAVMTLLSACNSNDRNPVKAVATSSPTVQTAQPQESPGDGVRRITTVELRELMEKGKAIVVDVRNEDAYKAGHIKGARLIPSTDILAHAGELPRDKMIVTYCT